MRLILAAVVLGFPCLALADTLITTSGSRWKGTVTEGGNNYIVLLSTGGKMVFPKEVVKEVIREEISPEEKARRERALKVNEALKPIRSSLEQAKSKHASELARVKARHNEDDKKGVADPFQFAVATARVKYLDDLIKQMKQQNATEAGLTVLVQDEDDKKKSETLDLTITSATAGQVTKEAQQRLKEAKTPPAEVLEHNQNELKAYGDLNRILDEADQAVKEAAKALDPIIEQQDKAKSELAKLQGRIAEILKRFAAGLDETARIYIPVAKPRHVTKVTCKILSSTFTGRMR